MTETEPIRDRSRAARAPRPVTIARHGRLSRTGPWRTVLGLIGGAMAVTLVSGGAVVGIAATQLQSDIANNSVAINETEAPIPDLGAYDGGFNILIVGSDEFHDRDSVLNDVNIIVHVAADHSSAVAVSLPRDMVVPYPSCTNENTGKKTSAASGLPINNALSMGGLGCVVSVVENFTGLDVHFAGMIGFEGVAAMSSAVGGVEVCVESRIKDRYTGLDLQPGTHTLEGWEALMFLRTRHGVGDGSDLTRISSQQVYMSSLVRKLKSEDTLTNATKLYGLAQAATKNMTLSTELSNPLTMISLAKALSRIPMERITFVQYPGSTGGPTGGVTPNKTLGNKLMDAIRADQAIALDSEGDGRGAVLDPNAPVEPEAPVEEPGAVEPDSGTVTPGAEVPATAEPPVGEAVKISGLRGQTAAAPTCSKGN
ncbi:LCP family protein [Salinibacterium sp. ZJ70]|uniref:LCP family protein n=1 Tax=Salinibacterium sp. ZJ70 TaxID=2708084 RepID=UPI00142014B7|nr:LCP family protein [Salinibacterium sp. ZJ70]